jgi:hypothetical protein
MKTFYRCLWILALLTLWVPATHAQTVPTLATLRIEVWPEYDRPTALVILDGELDSGVPLPAALSLRLPAAPFAVATRNTQNQLVDTAYTPQEQGTEVLINFTTDTPYFRVEYYDPALTIAGDQRTYEFKWVTPYAVKAVDVRTQIPAASRNPQFTPAFEAPTQGSDGLQYAQTTLGAQAAGQPVTFKMEYARSTTQLSSDMLVASAPAAENNSTAATTPTTEFPAWAIGVLGVLGGVLVGAGVVWFLRREPRTKKPAARRQRAHTPSANANHTPPASQAFCTQCGKPIIKGDTFCRSCGAKV